MSKYDDALKELKSLLDSVTFEVMTIETGVESLHNRKKLPLSLLKLFYTNLKRTKSYLEAAQDHAKNAPKWKHNHLFYEGGD